MAEASTFDRLVAELGQALLPLREALGSAEEFSGFLQKLGWLTDQIPPPLADLGGRVEGLYDALRMLLGDGGLNVGGSISTDGSATADFSVDKVARVLSAVNGVVDGIRAIASAPDSAIPESLRVDGFREVFPKQLVDHLAISYLQRFHPSIGFGLRTLGVIKSSYRAPSGGRLPYMHLSLDLADLPRLVGDPSLVFKNAFGWGEADFDFAALASQIDSLLMSRGPNILLEPLPPSTALAVQGPQPDPEAPRLTAMKAVIFERVRESGRMAAEVRLLPLPAGDSVAPGFAVLPSFDGALGFRFELGPDIAVTIRSDLDLRGGVALLVRPGRPIEMIVGFESAGAPVQAKGSIEVLTERAAADGAPTLILGSPNSSRLQFRKIGGTGGVRLTGEGDVDIFGEFDLRGLEFVFDPSGADGFIAKVLPGGGFTLGTDLTLGLSHRNGFYFRGTSNLQLQVPTHVEIGPVEIQSLTISAAPSGDALPIGLGATFKAELGPLKAVVEQIGLTAKFAFAGDHGGNLGPLDLSIGFRAPRGVGLSVDAGVVSGGGFLSFDPDNGEYAGALELEFANFVELKAIGLISTRMPDGSRGFSLLIIITAEFGGGGFQLGFGFTLLAVGGLIGLNRGMNLDALAHGVRSGSIESVMFPRDVIANAPRIISDLRAFFPAEQGKFLIGPMAKIGWGTPALITISVGVIIEIPGNIAIVGVLRCILPTKELPLLVLQVNFVGAIEFDKSRLWFFAELFDSRILFMTIEGGMGLLVGWGDDADLVVTVGGFHPSFKPPPLPFPVPRRLAVDILNQPGQRIRVEGYFAITSNTVQFGARAELVLGFGGFGLHGHLGFDALFQFSPFAFIIQISAGVSLRAFGVGVFSIRLRLTLEGPAPWRAHGTGSISLLFFEISADFDITWGEAPNTVLPPVDVLPLLANEFSKVEGWQTRLPTGGTRALVNLRELAPTDDLVLHPLGTLFVRQRAIPLNVRVDKVGQQAPRDGNRFDAAPAPDSGLIRVSVTGDKFAMAQFLTMDDAAKLSRPAYENQDAGLELTAAQGALASARVVRRSTRYELWIIDSLRPVPTRARRFATVGTAGQPGPRRRFHSVDPVVFDQLLQGSSTSRSPLSRRQAKLRQPFDDTVSVPGQRFVVAQMMNNRQAFGPTGSPAGSYRSRAAAEDALAEWVAEDARLAGTLHVIPEAEATGGLAVPEAWSAAGTLPAAAAWTVPHGAEVLLSNGKVLLAGGQDGTGAAVGTAALFDPVGMTWAAAGSLGTPRRLHTMTKLGSGRVLVTGGLTGDTATGLASTETYDPITGVWSPSGSLKSGRFAHSATLLPNGKVLVAGGTGKESSGALDSAELFDPSSGEWTPTGSMIDARAGHQAVLVDGLVLVIGGARPTGPDQVAALGYCEIYDPGTGTWAATGNLTTPRKGHQASVLRDGTVLVTGGDASGVPVDGTFDPASQDTAERFDPDTGTWTRTRSMPEGRSHHRSIVLRSGQVLVIGGTGAPAYDVGYRSGLVYDPAADTWRSSGAMVAGRSAFAAAELADGRVLVAGGNDLAGDAGPNQNVLVATAEMFTP